MTALKFFNLTGFQMQISSPGWKWHSNKAHAHIRTQKHLREDIWAWDCAESKRTRLLPARLGILPRRAGFFLTQLWFAFRGIPQQSSRSDCAVLYGWKDRRKRRITDNRHAGRRWEVTFTSLAQDSTFWKNMLKPAKHLNVAIFQNHAKKFCHLHMQKWFGKKNSSINILLLKY